MAKREQIQKQHTSLQRTPPEREGKARHRSAGLAGWANLQQQIGNQAVQRILGSDASATLQRQANELESQNETIPEKPSETVKFPSGASWIDRYPASQRLQDLDSNFGSDVREFVAVLEKASATVEVLATRMPPERAYLMHWAWRITQEGLDPRHVPYMDGVDIRWWHGNLGTSREAAWSMVHGYGIEELDEPPPLISPYTEGQVVAMRVRWRGALRLYPDSPQEQIITSNPQDGTNLDVMTLAEIHGLEHLLTVPDSDEVHWAMPGSE